MRQIRTDFYANGHSLPLFGLPKTPSVLTNVGKWRLKIKLSGIP